MPSFERPIRTVAVVGAGISGVCSAAHLLKQGLDVVLFERSSTAGGVWHFDKNSALDPDYPNVRPSLGDYKQLSSNRGCYMTPPRTPTPERSLRGPQKEARVNIDDAELVRRSIEHAPPGPCYAGLKNNVSLPAMKTTLGNWPEGLPDFVNQQYLEQYIQAIAETSGVNRIAEYNTRVEEVRKRPSDQSWSVRSTTFRRSDRDCAIEQRHWQFDAIVVASGHYNMPRIPDIPGLKEAKARFPDQIKHSKGYRSPVPFKDKRILLVGAGVSSTDIAKEAEAYAKQIYQSSRGGALDLPPGMLPNNALRIGGIKSFHLVEDSKGTSSDKDWVPSDALPGYIELNNGSKLRTIDQIILGTGYVTSYPFLGQFHADDVQPEDADDSMLVTADGNMVHNLHKDIFYCSDPSLAFVGVPYHISTFSLFEFQAQIVARVFAGQAFLPSEEEMKQQYKERLARRSPGRDFHSLREEGHELGYVADLVAWANEDRLKTGALPMSGHTEQFLAAHREQRERLRALGRKLERGAPGENFDHVQV